MEYEHLILLWKAAKGEISNNLGNCFGFPSFSSSHNRDVSEAICLFAFHGRLLHCTAWLAVQAWVVWKTIKWTRWSAGFRSNPVGSVFMLGREASTWVPQQDNHTLVQFLLPAVDVGPSQASSISPAISLASAGKAQLHMGFYTKSLWEQRHPGNRTCSTFN